MVLEVEVMDAGGRWGGAGGPVDLGERPVRTRMSAVAGDGSLQGLVGLPEVRGSSLGPVRAGNPVC